MEFYGLERIPDNSLMVVCGGEVVVAAADDVAAAVDVAATNGVGVVVGDATAVFVWVQQCYMRACTSPKSHLVSMVVTLRGKKLSW